MAFDRNAVQPYNHVVAQVQPFAPRYRVAYQASEDPFTLVTLVLASNFDSLHARSPLRRDVDQDIMDGDIVRRDTRSITNAVLTYCETDGDMGIAEGNAPDTFRIWIKDKSNGYAEVGPFIVGSNAP